MGTLGRKKMLFNEYGGGQSLLLKEPGNAPEDCPPTKKTKYFHRTIATVEEIRDECKFSSEGSKFYQHNESPSHEQEENGFLEVWQEGSYAIDEELAREKFLNARLSSGDQTMSDEINVRYPKCGKSDADEDPVKSGSYGTVHFCKDGSLVIKNAFTKDEESKRQLRNELKAYIRMQAMARSNTFSLYSDFIFDSNGDIALRMKHGGKPLRVYLEDIWKEKGAEEEISATMRQILKILKRLHEAGIRHGDPHCDNWCVDKQGYPRPIDFGCARFKVDSGGEQIEDNDWAKLVVADYQQLLESMIRWVTGEKRSYGEMGGIKEEVHGIKNLKML